MTVPQVRRAVLITLDGLGVGALPDAAAYGDVGANTLLHICRSVPGLDLPRLARLGLARLLPPGSLPATVAVEGAWGRMAERSPGKDTLTGHWELAGLILERPFATFPAGFPPAIIAAFRAETGLDPLGNIAASGTEILRQLGEEHCRTGRPIVYTSADSVFQIAAHEQVIPPERLYRLCRIARQILDPWNVGRVIARPFIGSGPDDFRRTPRRHDLTRPPAAPTLLDRLQAAGIAVHGIGKIHDIYAGRGLTSHCLTRDNREGMERTLEALSSMPAGLVFVNLVDFDMLYGHRNDPAGFAAALRSFDAWLPALQARLEPTDLLIITADHGCDPTLPGSDHSREYVPLLVWQPGMRGEVELGERRGFSDVAATLAELFGVRVEAGESFAARLGQARG